MERSREVLLRHLRRLDEPTSEGPILPPTVTMRPSHFFRVGIRNALLGLQPSYMLAETASRMSLRHDFVHLEDVTGNADASERTLHDQILAYLTRLGDLPNSDSVVFNLEPKDICASCRKEEVVDGIDLGTLIMPVLRERGDVEPEELWCLRGIKKIMETMGLVNGKDWMMLGPTTHVLSDSNGDSLTNSKIAPRIVDLFPLVVKIAALRQLLHSGPVYLIDDIRREVFRAIDLDRDARENGGIDFGNYRNPKRNSLYLEYSSAPSVVRIVSGGSLN